MILLAATIIALKPPFTAEIVYLVPSILVLLVYGMAFGLLLSALNVYLRDIQYLVEVVMLLLLWASPIVYPWKSVADILGHSVLLDIYTDNPVTLSVLGFQRAMWIDGHTAAVYPAELGMRLGIAFAVGVIFLVVFQRIFSRLQGNFAQEV
jgi:ABC-2 type transport system permease protein